MKGLLITTMVLSLLILSGCSSSPPDDIIKFAAVRTLYTFVGEQIVKDIKKGAMSITEFKILNDYKKTINNEEVYIYEVEIKTKYNESNKLLGGGQTTFGLTKRGNSWYIVK